MTTERQAWATLHPLEPRERRNDSCTCGQDLDLYAGRHCPRCGTSIAARAA